MNDLTLQTASSESLECAQLEARSDAALRELIAQAAAILEDRATARRRDALAEIKRLAKENGLNVSVKTGSRKRGRPAKKAGLSAN